jgi:hypothetical protein
VTVIGVVVRPRSTFAALAASPRLPLGFAAVMGSGLVALVLGLIADRLGSGGTSGLVTSLLLPVLFLIYWGAAALIIDAVAGLTADARRWRAYLSVSGFTFIPWVAFGVLAVVEAIAGTGSVAESVISWLTLPLLVWFLSLTALAVYTVFEVSPFVALALAMLPDAVLLFLLIVLLVVASL